jgi:hypothetical protein
MECAGKAQRRRRFSHALKPSRQKRCRAPLATALHMLFLGVLRGFHFVNQPDKQGKLKLLVCLSVLLLL